MKKIFAEISTDTIFINDPKFSWIFVLISARCVHPRELRKSMEILSKPPNTTFSYDLYGPPPSPKHTPGTGTEQRACTTTQPVLTLISSSARDQSATPLPLRLYGDAHTNEATSRCRNLVRNSNTPTHPLPAQGTSQQLNSVLWKHLADHPCRDLAV